MSYATDRTAAIALIISAITSKTTPSSIVPSDVGGVDAAIIGLCDDLFALIGAAASLQGVTAVGATTTIGVTAVNTAVSSSPRVLDISLSPDGNITFLFSLDGSNSDVKSCVLSTQLLTDLRGWLLPDEGNGSGLASTIVLHTTKDPITVGTATDGTVVNISGATVSVGGAIVAELAYDNTNGSFVLLKDKTNAFVGQILGGNGNLTANRTYTVPNKTGTLALVSDIQDLLSPVAVQTANYVAAAGQFVPCDVSGGNITVTLPTAPPDKTTIGVKMVKAVTATGIGGLAIACGGSDVFNITGGNATLSLQYNNQAVRLQYKAAGAIWYVMSTDAGNVIPRYASAASSALPTINTDITDTYELTAQAVDITSFTTNLTGTPFIDQILHIIITATGGHNITAWGTKFESSAITLPSAFVSGRQDYYFVWNATASKWRLGGVW